MPGIAWLAMHPPKGDVFPWWTGYLLNAMSVIMVAMLIGMVAIIASDFWREMKRKQ